MEAPDLAPELTPTQILHQALSSSNDELPPAHPAQPTATSIESSFEFRRIGAGGFGTIFARSDQPIVYKRESHSGGGLYSLEQEILAHKLIFAAFSLYDLKVAIPEPYDLITFERESWWSENASHFPPSKYDHDLKALEAERIPSVPCDVRSALVDT